MTDCISFTSYYHVFESLHTSEGWLQITGSIGWTAEGTWASVDISVALCCNNWCSNAWWLLGPIEAQNIRLQMCYYCCALRCFKSKSPLFALQHLRALIESKVNSRSRRVNRDSRLLISVGGTKPSLPALDRLVSCVTLALVLPLSWLYVRILQTHLLMPIMLFGLERYPNRLLHSPLFAILGQRKRQILRNSRISLCLWLNLSFTYLQTEVFHTHLTLHCLLLRTVMAFLLIANSVARSHKRKKQ